MRNCTILLFIICIVLLFRYLKISSEISSSDILWINITIQDGLGPMISVEPGLTALLDTGSPYLFTTDHSSDMCGEPENTNIQEYHYAGPSAEFKWQKLDIIVGGKDLGCITAGVVSPSSVKDFGLEAIVGLVPLPAWASQRFNQESFVNEVNLSSFSFDLRDLSSPKFAFGLPKHTSSDRLIANIPITPQICLPTPGLSFTTTAITGLDVRYKDGDGYSITRSHADVNVAQSYKFIITDRKSRKRESLRIMEWFCMFDTGTFPAVFQANGSANLLGPRVTQSMIPGQINPNTYMYADISYEFLDNVHVSLHVSHTKIPKLNLLSFADVEELLTVCGFGLQLNHRVDYEIDKEIGLPKSVQFFK